MELSVTFTMDTLIRDMNSGTSSTPRTRRRAAGLSSSGSPPEASGRGEFWEVVVSASWECGEGAGS